MIVISENKRSIVKISRRYKKMSRGHVNVVLMYTSAGYKRTVQSNNITVNFQIYRNPKTNRYIKATGKTRKNKTYANLCLINER